MVWFATTFDHWDSLELQNKQNSNKQIVIFKGLKLQLSV